MVAIIWEGVPSLVGGGVSLGYDLGGGVWSVWEDERGLGEVLLQSEVEVADLELLGKLEGDVGGLLTEVFGGAGEPLIDWRLAWAVAPPAEEVLLVWRRIWKLCSQTDAYARHHEVDGEPPFWLVTLNSRL